MVKFPRAIVKAVGVPVKFIAAVSSVASLPVTLTCYAIARHARKQNPRNTLARNIEFRAQQIAQYPLDLLADCILEPFPL